MIEYVMLGTIALLYVLGTFQGQTICEEIEKYLPADTEVSTAGKFLMKWLWPLATARAIWNTSFSQEDDND